MALSTRSNFLTDVSTVAKSLEQTLKDLRLSTNTFPNLEQVLTNQIKPEAITSDLLNQTEFITLAGDYLKLVPLDVSIGWTTDKNPQTRGPHEALRNQYVGNNMWGQGRWSQFYNDPVRQSIEETIARFEANLNSFGTILAKQASTSLPSETFIPVGGINASYIGSLRVQAYRNAGLRLYEDPERMFTLAFRALATKRGWLRKTSQGQYQLAKNGEELIAELHDAQLTEQQFEQYTGAKVTLNLQTIPPVTRSQITGGTPASESNQESTPTNYKTIVMPQTSTWAQGANNLQSACKTVSDNIHPTIVQQNGVQVYRPLTLTENYRARIVDAVQHHGDITKSPTWQRWNDSCTAIIYGENGLFKVQKMSPHLIALAQNFNQTHLTVNYNDIQGSDVREFNRVNQPYNTCLTEEEARNLEFYIWLFEDNQTELDTYIQLHWSKKRAGHTGMGVYLRDQTVQGELRAVFVNNHYDSDAYCNYDLNNGGSFLRRVVQ